MASVKASEKLRLLVPPPHICRQLKQGAVHIGSRTSASSGRAFGQQDVTCGFSPSEDAASENINQLCRVKCAKGVGRGGGTMRGERRGNGRGMFC